MGRVFGYDFDVTRRFWPVCARLYLRGLSFASPLLLHKSSLGLLYESLRTGSGKNPWRYTCEMQKKEERKRASLRIFGVICDYS